MVLLFQSGKSVKDKIIITLGYIWPLKAKEILSYIKGNFNANVTYQAVYKSINELMEGGVIVKTGGGFTLNKSWVSSLKEYMIHVDQSYKTDNPKKEITNSEQIIVDSIYDFYMHVLSILEKLAKDKYATSVPSVFRALHAWNPLIVDKNEFSRTVKAIPNYKIYTIVSANTPLDRALARYWKSVGVYFQTNISLLITNDVVVIGDYVIQIIYPSELISFLDKFFKETKTIEEMDIIKIQKDIYYKKMPIPVITVKNRTLADELRKETLSFFE